MSRGRISTSYSTNNKWSLRPFSQRTLSPNVFVTVHKFHICLWVYKQYRDHLFVLSHVIFRCFIYLLIFLSPFFYLYFSTPVYLYLMDGLTLPNVLCILYLFFGVSLPVAWCIFTSCMVCVSLPVAWCIFTCCMVYLYLLHGVSLPVAWCIFTCWIVYLYLLHGVSLPVELCISTCCMVYLYPLYGVSLPNLWCISTFLVEHLYLLCGGSLPVRYVVSVPSYRHRM